VIDGFRSCVLGSESRLHLPGFIVSLGVIALFSWLGITHFRRTRTQLRRLDLKWPAT
jgi:hypothetical protein